MEYLQNLLTVAWALRWVLAFAVMLVLLGLWLDARRERDEARAKVRDLVIANAERRARLARRRTVTRVVS